MASDPERFKQWFSPADLDANRAGHLAPDQARRLGLQAAVGRGANLVVGLGLIIVAIVIAALALAGNTTVAPSGAGPTLIGAVVVALIGLVFFWVGRRGSFSHEVAAGTVDHATGPAVLSLTEHSGEGNSTYVTHELAIGQMGRRFQIDGHLYRAITQGEALTAYYLAGAGRLVNLESAAASQAAGVSDPIAAAAAAAAAEVVAGPADGTPLQQAIIGRWRGADMGSGLSATIEFRADGTLTMGADLSSLGALDALPGPLRALAQRADQPRTMRYHWTDADHIAVDGQPGTAQVRLAGGHLIVDLPDGEQRLTRLADTAAANEEAHP